MAGFYRSLIKIMHKHIFGHIYTSYFITILVAVGMLAGSVSTFAKEVAVSQSVPESSTSILGNTVTASGGSGSHTAISKRPDHATRVAKMNSEIRAALTDARKIKSDELRKTLIARRYELARVALTDPARFKTLLLSRDERALIPEDLRGLTEQETSVTGKAQNVPGDDMNNQDTPDRNENIEIPYLILDNDLVSSFINIGPTPTPKSESSMTVEGFTLGEFLIGSIIGITPATEDPIVVNGGMIFNPTVAGNQVLGTLPSKGESVPEEPTTEANTTIAVFLVKYQDTTSDPFDAATAYQNIFKGNVANFFEEQSYGKVKLDGNVYGWITEAKNSSTCMLNNATTIAPDSALAAYIAENNIDLSSFTYTFIIHNCPDYTGFNGIATPWTNTAASMGSTWWYENNDWSPYMSGWTPTDRVISHELGHLFGLDHSDGLDCDDVTMKENIFDCSMLDAGNYFDAMGNDFYSMHFSAIQKRSLGWIPESDVLAITESGDYTLRPLEGDEGSRLAEIYTMIGATAVKTPYLLEYRAPKLFDASLLNFSPKGLSLLYDYSGTTYILDANPTSQEFGDDMKDWTISKNRNFTDPKYGLSIGGVGMQLDGSIAFRVDLEVPSCEEPVALAPTGSTIRPVNSSNVQKGSSWTSDSPDPLVITLAKSTVDSTRLIVSTSLSATNANESICGLQQFTTTTTSPDPTLIYYNYIEYEGTNNFSLYVAGDSSKTISNQIIVPIGTAVGTYEVEVATTNNTSSVIAEPLIYTIVVE